MQRGKNKYMSIQLLDKTRKLNRLLKNAESSEISFSEISKVLKEMLHSNVLVLSKKGKILGISHEDSMESIKELLGEKRGVRIDASLNERLLAVLSTRENVYLQTLGFSNDTKNYHGMIVPIDIAGERLGTLFMYRAEDIYDIEDIILCEYGATVIGMEMMRAENDESAEESRKQHVVQSALGTLSGSELKAMRYVFEELQGTDGILVASKIAEQAGITRSIIVTGLKKLESAGVIESRSAGMKGTKVRICNEMLMEELENMKS